MSALQELIPKGKENAVSRSELVAETGESDRKVRRMIQQLRAEGDLIVNDGSGYYVVDETDLDAIERQYKADTARAMAILQRRKRMRKILKEAGRKV